MTTTRKPHEIRVGDHVRAYDFPDVPGMKTTCYVEGVVEAIGRIPEAPDCDRYTIRITRRVWKGQEDEGWQTKEFPTGRAYPPVNGIPSWLGGATNGVKLLPQETPPQPADPTGTRQPQRLTWRQLARRRDALVPAFEKHLRGKGWPYVAVDKAKKAIFSASKVRAFDFIIYNSAGPNLLAMVVTSRPTAAQVKQMRDWEQVFGDGFQAAFVFKADDEPPAAGDAQWRMICLNDLQTFSKEDPLANSRPLDECLGQLPNEGSKQ